MSPITLWGRRSALNVQKVLWTLGELGLDFVQRDVGGRFGGLDAPEFRRLNPNGRVPVLEDAGSVIWESHSIVRYLAARYAPGTLGSESPAARSLEERWMDWAQTALQPDFMRLFWGYYRTPARDRDAAAIGAALAACDRHLGLLDDELAARPFLAGSRFTMADVPAGTCPYRYFEMGVEVPERPHVRAWNERLGERSAYRDHVMVPFEELRGRLAY